MSLAETCYELAHGDGYHALRLALLAVGHGQTVAFTICENCGGGFEASMDRARFCSEQCRKNTWGKLDKRWRVT